VIGSTAQATQLSLTTSFNNRKNQQLREIQQNIQQKIHIGSFSIETHCQYSFKTQIKTFPYREIKKNPWINHIERNQEKPMNISVEFLNSCKASNTNPRKKSVVSQQNKNKNLTFNNKTRSQASITLSKLISYLPILRNHFKNP